MTGIQPINQCLLIYVFIVRILFLMESPSVSSDQGGGFLIKDYLLPILEKINLKFSALIILTPH